MPLMHSTVFRTLLVEDNPADTFLVNKLLSSSSAPMGRLGSFNVTRVARLEEGLRELARANYDVILLDLLLPDSQGLETLRAVQQTAGETPIVVLTGFADAELAVQALTLGAQDFLNKDGLGGEVITRTLRYAIERRRAQRQLLSALREKDVLLRELHHRAKNNLQVVASLLSMQARRSTDPQFKSLVDAARERIDSIALAQDQLHASPDLGRIDFSTYLSKLACAVHASYGGPDRGIELSLQVGTFELPLDQAVSAGLIVNELLTNAFKHAFPEERAGVILLHLQRDDERFVLRVEDDGVGIYTSPSNAARPLGLELVATMVEQLDASIEHQAGPGTRFRLSFPARES